MALFIQTEDQVSVVFIAKVSDDLFWVQLECLLSNQTYIIGSLTTFGSIILISSV